MEFFQLIHVVKPNQLVLVGKPDHVIFLPKTKQTVNKGLVHVSLLHCNRQRSYILFWETVKISRLGMRICFMFTGWTQNECLYFSVSARFGLYLITHMSMLC